MPNWYLTPQTEDEFNQMVKDAKVALIFFSTTWAGPCKTQAPILEKVATAYGGKLTVIKVDTDQLKVVAQNLKIPTVPSVLISRSGVYAQRQVGLIAETKLLKLIGSIPG